MKILPYQSASGVYDGSGQRKPVSASDFQEQLTIRKEKAQMIKTQPQRKFNNQFGNRGIFNRYSKSAEGKTD